MPPKKRSTPHDSEAVLGTPPDDTPLVAPDDTPVEIAGTGAVVRVRPIQAYALDSENPNKGGKRSNAILRRSLAERGAGRSILADRRGVLIAGNQTQQAAVDAGIKRVVEIETEGDVLIVHKRRDLDLHDDTDTRGRQMSYDDNRSRDLSEWNADRVMAAADAGLIDDLLFRADEIDDMVKALEAEALVTAAEAEAVTGGRPSIDADRQRVIRIAVYAKHLRTMERAIATAGRAIGSDNRADVLAYICQRYLDSIGGSEPQKGT